MKRKPGTPAIGETVFVDQPTRYRTVSSRMFIYLGRYAPRNEPEHLLFGAWENYQPELFNAPLTLTYTRGHTFVGLSLFLDLLRKRQSCPQ